MRKRTRSAKGRQVSLQDFQESSNSESDSLPPVTQKLVSEKKAAGRGKKAKTRESISSASSSSEDVQPPKKKKKGSTAKPAPKSKKNATKGKVKSRGSAEKKKASTTSKTLLQTWLVVGLENDESGSDYHVRKSKPSRGANQSKVPGEVQPVPHGLERERKVKSYTPKGSIGRGKHKLGGKRTTDPKTVKAADRVRDHPNQSFESKQNNVLYCRACTTEVSKKESSIVTHLKVSVFVCS